VRIEFVGPLPNGGRSRPGHFIMCLAYAGFFVSLEEHLEKQGLFESGFLCLDNNVREHFDFG
jgi:hypothetical protein